MFQSLEKFAWTEISSLDIHTTKDVAVLFKFQKLMVEKARAKGGVFGIVELEAGRGIHLSETTEMVKIIDALVDQDV